MTYNRFSINICWVNWWIELCENQRDWFYKFRVSKLRRLPNRSLSYNLYKGRHSCQGLHFFLQLPWISPLWHRCGVRHEWTRFHFQIGQQGLLHKEIVSLWLLSGKAAMSSRVMALKAEEREDLVESKDRKMNNNESVVHIHGAPLIILLFLILNLVKFEAPGFSYETGS